ncbi:MAG: NAD(P)(+) transhydrogenase (Re/Si-specific) subunit beta, partial [Gammaproteobacteria bacterium]
AQAQHVVSDFADLLVTMGIEVEYGIHPVAGRMPGEAAFDDDQISVIEAALTSARPYRLERLRYHQRFVTGDEIHGREGFCQVG